jgi:membrane protease subunit HflK
MYLETMERVLGGASKIIIDSKDGAQGVVPYLPLSALAPPSQPHPPARASSASQPQASGGGQ